MARWTAVLLTAAVVAACQSTAPNPSPVVLSLDNIERLRVERDERRISYHEWAERTGAAARASGSLSRPEEEALRRRQVLTWQVDAGTLTPEQFEVEIAAAVERLKAAKTARGPSGDISVQRGAR